MKASRCNPAEGAFLVETPGSEAVRFRSGEPRVASRFWTTLNGAFDVVAPCPWSAHVGLSAVGTAPGGVASPAPEQTRSQRADHSAAESARPAAVPAPFDSISSGAKSPKRPSVRAPLYNAAERLRRDQTPWTRVQAILAPLQFAAFLVSLILIFRYMTTGQGYAAATTSILVKTALLYTIMITGSIWEKAVFGKWLFARAFFWEDAFSMLVLSLQTAYLASLLLSWGTPAQQMSIAVAAYAAYAINASQFLLKLRAARLEAPVSSCLAV